MAAAAAATAGFISQTIIKTKTRFEIIEREIIKRFLKNSVSTMAAGTSMQACIYVHHTCIHADMLRPGARKHERCLLLKMFIEKSFSLWHLTYILLAVIEPVYNQS